MNPFFLDTSALAKRYVDETGSEWISKLFTDEADASIYIAELTPVELISAIVRRSRGGSISPEERDFTLAEFDLHLVRDYFVLEVASSLLSEARLLVVRHGLRAYDAVQLAVAESFNRGQLERNLPSVTLVSADVEILTAAARDGLPAENPNDYP